MREDHTSYTLGNGVRGQEESMASVRLTLVDHSSADGSDGLSLCGRSPGVLYSLRFSQVAAYHP